MHLTQQIDSVIEHLYTSAEVADFSGDDPFDGLNAYPFRKWPNWQNTLIGLAWTQLFKRSPINFRRLAGVPKRRNPKGVALFISGMLLKHQRQPNPELLIQAQKLGEWLVTQMCDQTIWGAPCWGYHFPWKARAFFVPMGKPNLITTVYVSKALYELGQACNNQQWIDIALSSADFMVNKLYNKSEQGDYFRYIPGESALVHNANLWAAAWVNHSAYIRNIEDHKALARRACWTSANAQQKNGSWSYGARSHHQFIDGFHTGYNLETLSMINDIWQNSDLQKVIDKGYDYYKQTLISEEGIAKYYHNNPYPLDTHNFAQAILTLLKLASTPADHALATKVIEYSLQHLYLSDQKRFVYQKDQYLTNSIDYSRWTQSWAYYALNFYLSKGISNA